MFVLFFVDFYMLINHLLKKNMGILTIIGSLHVIILYINYRFTFHSIFHLISPQYKTAHKS